MSRIPFETRKISKKKKEKILSKDERTKNKELDRKLEKTHAVSSLATNKDRDWYERIVPELKFTELCAYCEKLVQSRHVPSFPEHDFVTCVSEKCPFKDMIRLNINSPTVRACLKCEKKCEFYFTDIEPIVDRDKNEQG